MKNILVAPDSFKGSLTSIEACESIKKGLLKSGEDFNVTMMPMADGGEGTAAVITSNSKGEMKWKNCIGPIGEEIQVQYGILPEKNTAVIDIASCCGLEMVDKSIRTPMITSSRAVGELLKYLLDLEYRDFIIGLGGSGTNDGGIGMLQGLGASFLDHRGHEIKAIGGNLISIKDINLDSIDQRIFQSNITVACDVTNPMVGEKGATFVFGPQKGDTEEELDILEQGMKNYSDILKNKNHNDIAHIPGSGAAGGLGGAFYLLNGKMKSGIDLILDICNFEEALSQCDLVITGEGSVDFQTKFGKTIAGISTMAKKHNKPVIVITGAIGHKAEELYEIGVTSIFSIMDRPKTLEEAFKEAKESVVKVSENIGRTLLI